MKTGPNIEHKIAELIIEIEVNLICAKWIYGKLELKDNNSSKLDFLRFVANNCCDKILLNISSLLSPKRTKDEKDEISLIILDGKDDALEEIVNYYEVMNLKTIRNKGVAHKDFNHPNPAGNLFNLVSEDYLETLRVLQEKIVNYFQNKHNWDVKYLSKGDTVIKGLLEILNSI